MNLLECDLLVYTQLKHMATNGIQTVIRICRIIMATLHSQRANGAASLAFVSSFYRSCLHIRVRGCVVRGACVSYLYMAVDVLGFCWLLAG